jgi:nitrogen-specific signal transduction histidine kinase/ActR/RegA family two-component response regulator
VENALLYEQTLKDMTERELLQERLNQSQRMDSIGQLAGGVAHDFNNLLTVITGYTTMLLSKDPTEPADTDHLRAISKAAESGSKLTNQLLGFSRRQVIKPITLDLSDAAMSSYGMLRRVIGENIELVMLPAQDLPSVFVDPTQLDQIVMNLVLNARDAMTEGGTLTVATSHHQGELSEDYIGDCVVLSVSDTGVGMSEEVKAHLFEPFYTTKETGKGTGLGLATCYGIVEQNGGHIEVDSEPGRGSTFKIYLPVTEEREGSEPEDVGRSVSSSPSGTETILLVEDEPQVRAMESCILADQGYAILQAANGEEALQVCQANQDQDIQLLITDMVMPRMSGDELITELSSRRPEIKFLVVSGYAENTLERSVVARSDVHFMQKPFKPMELAETVRDILDGVSEPVA